MAKKRKKKVFSSPEDRAIWEAGSLQNLRRLNERIERASAELTEGMTAAEREAWEEQHRDSKRALQYYIDRAEAEQEAKRKSA